MFSKLFNLAKVKAMGYTTAINPALLVCHSRDEHGKGDMRRADKAGSALSTALPCACTPQLCPAGGEHCR